MAQGTVTVFDLAKVALADGTFDLDTHVFKVAFVSDTSLTAAEVAITLTDFTECSGGTYAADTIDNVTWTESSGTVTFDGDNVTWAQDAGSGPTDVRYGIIYDDTDGSDTALAMVYLTSSGDGTTAISLQTGDITITFNALGIFTLT